MPFKLDRGKSNVYIQICGLLHEIIVQTILRPPYPQVTLP